MTNRADDTKEPTTGSSDLGALSPAFAPEPAFHSDDVENVANYQSLSVLALFSLLIGLAAPLCLLSKAFLLLPLVGLSVSLLALRQIALSEGRLAGRGAATIGLMLCIASIATAVARDAVTRSMRTAQATEFARTWLHQVASDQTQQAFKSTYKGARPLTPTEPGSPAPEESPYDTFLGDALIQKIRATGKDARIELDKTLEFARASRREFTVRQRFLISPMRESVQSGAGDPLEVYLTLHRSRFRGDTHSRWLVMRYEPTNTPLQ
jgi:hypothetical protein